MKAETLLVNGSISGWIWIHSSIVSKQMNDNRLLLTTTYDELRHVRVRSHHHFMENTTVKDLHIYTITWYWNEHFPSVIWDLIFRYNMNDSHRFGIDVGDTDTEIWNIRRSFVFFCIIKFCTWDALNSSNGNH